MANAIMTAMSARERQGNRQFGPGVESRPLRVPSQRNAVPGSPGMVGSAGRVRPGVNYNSEATSGPHSLAPGLGPHAPVVEDKKNSNGVRVPRFVSRGARLT